MHIHIRDLIFFRQHPQDPPERWETPYTSRDGGFYFRSRSSGYPFVPLKTEEVPAGAWDTLREACGVESLEQIFVVPASVRDTGWRSPKVITPTEVLAIGSRAVGLWTGAPDPGVKLVIGLPEVASIEDVQILLYGRLSFLSAKTRLTIRYNTVSRHLLDPSLIALRKSLAGSRCRVPPQEDGAALPYKWSFFLSTVGLRLEKDALIAFRYSGQPPKQRRSTERGQLLTLNPYELIYMRDPEESIHDFGEDAFLFPRSRIEDVVVGAERLEVVSRGRKASLPIAAPLLAEAQRWLDTSGIAAPR